MKILRIGAATDQDVHLESFFFLLIYDFREGGCRVRGIASEITSD